MSGDILLIFDLDGTLFKTETVTIPAVQYCFQERGLQVPPVEEIRSFFGKPTREFHDWVRAHSTVTDDTDLVKSVSRMELELIEGSGELYPRIHEVLTVLDKLVDQMAICSNGTEKYVPRVLREHGIIHFFDAVSYRGNSGNNKPFMVRELLNQLDHRSAIVVGDRQDDVEAAHENGLLSIAAAYGYGTEDELECADAAADTPWDLTRLVPVLLDM